MRVEALALLCVALAVAAGVALGVRGVILAVMVFLVAFIGERAVRRQHRDDSEARR